MELSGRLDHLGPRRRARCAVPARRIGARLEQFLRTAPFRDGDGSRPTARDRLSHQWEDQVCAPPREFTVEANSLSISARMRSRRDTRVDTGVGSFSACEA